MSEIYKTGSDGERRLADHLTKQGRTVKRSDKKCFDLIVDGRYAEVKTSKGPYKRLGFIGLTGNQFKALKGGVDFNIFIVCNLNDPANLEIIEFAASALLAEEPKVEPHYYWYRPQIEKCRNCPPKTSTHP
jgi:hypothetical protein